MRGDNEHRRQRKIRGTRELRSGPWEWEDLCNQKVEANPGSRPEEPGLNHSVSSVQSLSHVRLFSTPWTAARQASLFITNSRSPPKPMSIELVMPSNHLILCRPLLLCPQSLSASGFFQWVNSTHEVAKVLEFQLQHQSFQWTPRTNLLYKVLIGSPCSPRDTQESSPTPQFYSINSSALSFLHSPTLTSIHDYWKNHSLD